MCAHFYRRGLGFKGHKIVEFKDVSTVKYFERPLWWWAESAPTMVGIELSRSGVKVSENLGAKAVILVAPVDTSLELNTKKTKILSFSILAVMGRAKGQLISQLISTKFTC